MIYPDYKKGSLVNLISSILSYYDMNTAYSPLENFSICDHKKLVFIVVDGLGMSFLETHGRDSLIFKNLEREITSVFPTTTSSALTALLSGLAPLQHGLTGWFMYFRELATAGISLPFKARFTEKVFADEGVDIQDIYNFETFFQKWERLDNQQKFNKKGLFAITPQTTINSAFSRFCYGTTPKKGYNNIEESFTLIKKKIFDAPEHEMIVAYLPQFDDLAHIFGINSHECIDFLKKLDALFDDLFKYAQDTETLFIVTADHGLIDTTKDTVLHISDYPDIQDCMILPLCGEPRTPFCYVRPAKLKYFIKAVEEQLGEYCDRFTMNDILERSLLGIGEINPKIYDRLGDEILIMKDNYVMIDNVYEEKYKEMIGFHGGMSRAEMMVPLICYSCL
ncbi:MAG: alkaline phosphatase family protein [Candidatus Cloacimonetes bacterium]|nr:alkaline phosphatase family protein [Candidatus Cloacimonadota bacterium]